jgi:D-glycero-D-manno-heptose 1,7-bisphosphate phosphatase
MAEDHRPLRAAVFFDRDGTLIEHVHYLSDPGHVRLMPGTAESLRKLRAAGFACVVVTNQSGIGRGLLTEADLERVHNELSRRLAAEGVAIDAYYHCPEVPRGDDPTVVEHEDRKPGPGMLRRAAGALGLDLGASWMVGDLVSDALAGVNAGCLGSILLRPGGPTPHDVEAGAAVGYHTVDGLPAAADLILAATAGLDTAAPRPGRHPETPTDDGAPAPRATLI